MNEDKKDELLSSFVSGATSSNVEIVFSFDTTGSMSSCLGLVRQKVSDTVTRLMKDIPKIRIGIIAHGDYCDGAKAISILDLCSDADKICKFVNETGATGGGDAPECYELALYEAKKLSWSEDYAKALVIIGDEVPHPPSYTTEKINWFDEVETLSNMGVKIYGVRALNCTYAIPFYEELSERTGAVSITFNSFQLIVDMFLAICYREASPEKLQEFQQEIQDRGNMTEEMGSILKTLSQPNPEKKKIDTNDKKSLRSTQPWYDIANDNGNPQYKFDKKRNSGCLPATLAPPTPLLPTPPTLPPPPPTPLAAASLCLCRGRKDREL